MAGKNLVGEDANSKDVRFLCDDVSIGWIRLLGESFVARLEDNFGRHVFRRASEALEAANFCINARSKTEVCQLHSNLARIGIFIIGKRV